MNKRIEFAAAALAVASALAVTAPAHAQFCSTICSRYESGECVEHTQTCTNQESPASIPKFGAIAYGSSSGSWGTSYDWGSRSRAESAAMKQCGAHGKDCTVVVWFDRKCGAVAAAAGGATFWGLGDGEGDARGQAQNACVRGGGKSCKVQVAQCSR